MFRAFLLPLRSKRMRAAAKNFIRTIVEARFVFILLIAIIVFATITGVLLLSRRYGTQASGTRGGEEGGGEGGGCVCTVCVQCMYYC